MSLTLFEGPDGAGKTTLLRSLAFGAFAVDRVDAHGPYLGDDGATIAARYLRSILAGRRAEVSMDRGWPSEAVYGPLARGVDRLGARARMLDRVALASRAVLVRVEPPFALAFEAWKARRGEEYVQDEARFVEVFNRYRASYPPSLPVVWVDRTRVLERHLAEYVATEIAVARPRPNLGPGIGAFGFFDGVPTQTLVIGEQSAGNRDLPFVSWRRDGCSLWFAEALDAAKVSEAGLYWVNARRPGGAWQNPAFIEALGPRAVIALGARAETWARRIAGFSGVERFDHPQYWKRFRHRDPYPAAARLAELSPLPEEVTR